MLSWDKVRKFEENHRSDILSTVLWLRNARTTRDETDDELDENGHMLDQGQVHEYDAPLMQRATDWFWDWWSGNGYQPVHFRTSPQRFSVQSHLIFKTRLLDVVRMSTLEQHNILRASTSLGKLRADNRLYTCRLTPKFAAWIEDKLRRDPDADELLLWQNAKEYYDSEPSRNVFDRTMDLCQEMCQMAKINPDPDIHVLHCHAVNVHFLLQAAGFLHFRHNALEETDSLYMALLPNKQEGKMCFHLIFHDLQGVLTFDYRNFRIEGYVRY